MSARLTVAVAACAWALGACAALRGASKDPAAAVLEVKRDATKADQAVSEACDVYATAVASHVVKPSKAADDVCAADAAVHLSPGH